MSAVSQFSNEDTAIFQVANLDLLVSSDDFFGRYDQLEVWRSRTSAGAYFEELTGKQWLCARLPKAAEDPPMTPVTGPSVNLVGKTLTLRLKEVVDIEVVFTGSDPLTTAQVAAQIASQSAGQLNSYVDSTGQLVVQTTEPGTGAVLRVMPSDAAIILALPTSDPDSLAFGRAGRISLVNKQEAYSFTDSSSAPADFYRTRFRNRSTGAVSDFSFSFSVNRSVGVSRASLSVGYLDLIALDGKALAYVDVSVRSPFVGGTVEGRLVAGADLVKKTDRDGHVEFLLIRGQQYTVGIAGTNVAKTVTAPVDPTVLTFSLIDPRLSDDNDYFRVRTPDLPTLERRSI